MRYRGGTKARENRQRARAMRDKRTNRKTNKKTELVMKERKLSMLSGTLLVLMHLI